MLSDSNDYLELLAIFPSFMIDLPFASLKIKSAVSQTSMVEISAKTRLVKSSCSHRLAWAWMETDGGSDSPRCCAEKCCDFSPDHS